MKLVLCLVAPFIFRLEVKSDNTVGYSLGAQYSFLKGPSSKRDLLKVVSVEKFSFQGEVPRFSSPSHERGSLSFHAPHRDKTTAMLDRNIIAAYRN